VGIQGERSKGRLLDRTLSREGRCNSMKHIRTQPGHGSGNQTNYGLAPVGWAVIIIGIMPILFAIYWLCTIQHPNLPYASALSAAYHEQIGSGKFGNGPPVDSGPGRIFVAFVTGVVIIRFGVRIVRG